MPGQRPPGHPPSGGAAAEQKPGLRRVGPGGFGHRPLAVLSLHPLPVIQLHYHHHFLGAVNKHTLKMLFHILEDFVDMNFDIRHITVLLYLLVSKFYLLIYLFLMMFITVLFLVLPVNSSLAT